MKRSADSSLVFGLLSPNCGDSPPEEQSGLNGSHYLAVFS